MLKPSTKPLQIVRSDPMSMTMPLHTAHVTHCGLLHLLAANLVEPESIIPAVHELMI